MLSREKYKKGSYKCCENIKYAGMHSITGKTWCGLFIKWLCNLFNMSLKVAAMPEDWKNAVIFPCIQWKMYQGWIH